MPIGLNWPASYRTDPGTIVRSKRIRWGDVIFFKLTGLQVEEIVFEVPRFRLTEHSEVFESLFQLPTGSDKTVEGQDEEHPIVLEGYQAGHFDALLKVLYPS
ncbi:hypothetical protein EST38_g9548 [Candolleomyces aberdarensis]|uniref:BTB domain-containing protein n=1 Tax=Candolleomyces aberdarensis TaxID=2316362 RepID=A0A4Q2DCX3_9AGAR|nr:hypothetical protein EST38_g9548 [Candolleomyces aberdarensis]